MTIIKHELKINLKSFIIWTSCITFLFIICVFMYPEMKGEMDGVSDMFGSMGSFTEAFGMDKLNFGTFLGFYAIECGNILGLGGAFFASLISINALAKEEREHTAEFLLTHPISRKQVITEKLIAIIIQIVILNIIVFVLSLLSIAMIKENINFKELFLLHLANLLMQLELACILFGVSAFITNGGLGIGLGVATLMYFLNIISNISSSAKFLKYITPYGYTEGADIINDGNLKLIMVLLGIIYSIISVVLAYIKYTKKNIK